MPVLKADFVFEWHLILAVRSLSLGVIGYIYFRSWWTNVADKKESCFETKLLTYLIRIKIAVLEHAHISLT